MDENVLGNFVDMLDKLCPITKHIIVIPIVVDAHGNNVDGIRLQALYQGLEARIRNNSKNPVLGKLVGVAQAEIQRTRESIDKAGRALLDKMAANLGMAVFVSRRLSSAEINSPSKDT